MFSFCRQHIIDLGLVDTHASKNEDLGFIRFYVMISPVTEQEPTTPAEQKLSVLDKKSNKTNQSHQWKNTLTVTLLEGSNFPAMDQNGMLIVGNSCCCHSFGSRL